MKTIEEIQDSYAKANKYDNITDLLLDNEKEIEWHVSAVQKEYAQELVKQIDFKLLSIQDNKGNVFSIGDTIKFSDRFNSFVLAEIRFNANERRLELHGDGLFCTLNSSDCHVTTPSALKY